MRDDSRKWTPPADLSAPIDLGMATLSRFDPARLSLISGPKVRRTGPAPVGWPDVATGDTYRLSLRRDRIVEVGGAEGRDGWDKDTGRAFSDITDAYASIALSGPGAFEILKRGTEISPSIPSASVARRLFGLDVWLYRYGSDDSFRLHVVHAYEEALLGNVKAAAALMEWDA